MILKKIWLALILLSAIQIVGSHSDTVVVEFDLNKKSIEEFFTEFRVKVIHLTGTTYGDGHYILSRERGDYNNEGKLEKRLEPMWWIKVILIGEEQRKSSLYFRGDILYLVATANEDANIFYMGKDQYTHETFKDGTEMGFSEKYSDLLGKGRIEDLYPLVLIGRNAALASSTVIATYKGEPDQEVHMKLAVSAFTLMIQ